MKKLVLFIFISICISNIYAQKRSYLLFFDFKNGDLISSENGTVDGVLSLSKCKYDSTIVGVYYKYDENNKTKETNPDGTPKMVRKNDILCTTGIIDVKFNSENGQIKAGDYVTSSSTPGVAMKATKDGMILGVAFEDTNSNEGLVKIRILIDYKK